jgi:hypothetical protein
MTIPRVRPQVPDFSPNGHDFAPAAARPIILPWFTSPAPLLDRIVPF